MSAAVVILLIWGMVAGVNPIGVVPSDSLLTRIVVDQDGNENVVRKIGSQWWFANNLKVRTYANGDPIEFVSDPLEWSQAQSGAYSVYNNDPALVEPHGYLYNWFAVVDERGVCPVGWAVPTDEDWAELEAFLGMDGSELFNAAARGGAANVGGMLKDSSGVYWAEPNVGAVNAVGLDALGSGSRFFNGNYSGMGRTTFWWTSTHRNTAGLYPNRVWVRFLSHHGAFVSRISSFMESGMSIRCTSR